MPGQVKVGGAWKTVASAGVKVGGAWKTVSAGYTRVAGVWKQWYSSAPTPAMELIESNLTISTASYSITGLDAYASTYKHLQFRIVHRTSNTTNSLSYIRFRFNGSASGYSWHSLRTEGSTTPVSDNGINTSYISAGINPRGSTNSTTAFATTIIDVLDFASASKNKTIRYLNGFTNFTATYDQVTVGSGLWANTSPVTSIELADVSGYSFRSGTRVSVYGIKG